MAQSVELVLDASADAAVRAEWRALREAGLPSEQRSQPAPSHRPHVTLYAGSGIDPEAEAALPELVAGLDLELAVGAPLVFGPGRGGLILVRSVVASAELLTVQRRVAAICEAAPEGQFGPGRWVPHVTLARRMTPQQVGLAVGLLARNEPLVCRVTRCRRWDGDTRRDWEIG